MVTIVTVIIIVIHLVRPVAQIEILVRVVLLEADYKNKGLVPGYDVIISHYPLKIKSEQHNVMRDSGHECGLHLVKNCVHGEKRKPSRRCLHRRRQKWTNGGAQWIYLRSLLLHAVKRRDKPGRPVVASQS